MKTWLARCLAGTLGCGGLALLAGLLSALLSAGGDDAGGRALRISALLMGAVAAAGVTTLVVMLSALQLGMANHKDVQSTSNPTTDTKAS